MWLWLLIDDDRADKLTMVQCPICGKPVKEININAHIDANCETLIEPVQSDSQKSANAPVPSFFQPTSARKAAAQANASTKESSSLTPARNDGARKLSATHSPGEGSPGELKRKRAETSTATATDSAKRARPNAVENAAPLAERMRPKTLDEIYGQELVGPHGVLRGLIEQNRVPSMILWGGAGTGKTTIARVIASMVGSRFIEINSTNTGVAECKKIFADARSELSLTGRKTIVFCDEIHRFSKSQQDVFLGPVESGTITLIGATTENPSFKVQNALLSRCRTFTLNKLSDDDIVTILRRALEVEGPKYKPSELVNDNLIRYLAAFADGDARTALNLLELAMGLSTRPGMTMDDLKKSLTKTLVYDRAGDQHYDTISAFHKSIRGGDPDAALYYLARMLQSGRTRCT